MQAESRSTSLREVLPLIYELIGIAADPSAGTGYQGHPTAADASLAAPWLYGALPAPVTLAWRRSACALIRATGELW